MIERYIDIIEKWSKRHIDIIETWSIWLTISFLFSITLLPPNLSPYYFNIDYKRIWNKFEYHDNMEQIQFSNRYFNNVNSKHAYNGIKVPNLSKLLLGIEKSNVKIHPKRSLKKLTKKPDKKNKSEL